MVRLAVRLLGGFAALIGLVVLIGGTSLAATSADSIVPTVLPGIGEVSAPTVGGTVKLRVPLTLSAPATRAVRVHWATLDVADAPSTPEPQAPVSDYTPKSGVVIIPAGSTKKTVSFSVTGDAADQLEYVAISFTDPTNAIMGGDWGLGFGLIDPNGAPTAPTVSFDGIGEFGYGGEPVPVTLSHPSSRPITVDFTTSDGPNAILYWAEWIGDAGAFSPASGTVTFAPGQVSADIDLTVLSPTTTGCSIFYPPANCYPSAYLNLSNPTNATLGANPTFGLDYIPPLS